MHSSTWSILTFWHFLGPRVITTVASGLGKRKKFSSEYARMQKWSYTAECSAPQKWAETLSTSESISLFPWEAWFAAGLPGPWTPVWSLPTSPDQLISISAPDLDMGEMVLKSRLESHFQVTVHSETMECLQRTRFCCICHLKIQQTQQTMNFDTKQWLRFDLYQVLQRPGHDVSSRDHENSAFYTWRRPLASALHGGRDTNSWVKGLETNCAIRLAIG